ncbi:hypothetical protein I7I48_00753 [Histoplasma ohiense]|nr:hypothetical protein I7I48_00753 [Histoplasma ohiense (nom. inval.)]
MSSDDSPTTLPLAVPSQPPANSPNPTVRRARRKMIREVISQTKLTDRQLREVLAEAHESGTMLFDGQFARRYVKQSFLTDEEASRVLWRKTEDLVLFHMRHTSVYASTFTLSTDGHGVLELWWREKEPKIPPVLLGCPGIALREVYEHPAKDIIPDCHNADFLKPGNYP